MNTTQEVFRLRRAGQVDEAYAIARQLVKGEDADPWDVRALSWCLIDLIKRAESQNNHSELAMKAAELKELTAPGDDEILAKQREFALSLADPNREEIVAAQTHSKAGRHMEAARIYGNIMSRNLLYPGNHQNYGWDLYRWTKEILSGSGGPSPASIAQARRNLNAYMKLTVERPSLLHSLMLQMAFQIAGQDQLKLSAFLDLWGVENLRKEDFERFTTDDGKTLPSLAEKVVQRSAKEAAANNDVAAMRRLLPFLDRMMTTFPDNTWFRLSRVKFLRGLGRQDEAREQAIAFAREKSREFWVWDLLGDLQERKDLRLACYCKGLLCSSEEEFIGPLRLKLAHELLDAGFKAEAKGEIDAVIAHRRQAGHQIPRDAQELASQGWFSEATASPPNRQFYARFAPQADEILFDGVPWMDACAGESFSPDNDPKKVRRKIYVPGNPVPLEISVSEKALGLRGLTTGDPIQIKADLDTKEPHRIKIYTARLRAEGRPYDIFPETVGIIDHVNAAKGVLHVVAGRNLESVLPISNVGGHVKVGDHLALRLARFSSKNGGGMRVLAAVPTDAVVSEKVSRPFREAVRISDGMGFTPDGVFIPPDLVQNHDIDDGDVISGQAVINYNKKKGVWGWRAIALNVDDAQRLRMRP